MFFYFPAETPSSTTIDQARVLQSEFQTFVALALRLCPESPYRVKMVEALEEAFLCGVLACRLDIPRK